MSVWSSYKVDEQDKIDVAYSVIDDEIRVWIKDDTDCAYLLFDEALALANKIIQCVKEREGK